MAPLIPVFRAFSAPSQPRADQVRPRACALDERRKSEGGSGDGRRRQASSCDRAAAAAAAAAKSDDDGSFPSLLCFEPPLKRHADSFRETLRGLAHSLGERDESQSKLSRRFTHLLEKREKESESGEEGVEEEKKLDDPPLEDRGGSVFSLSLSSSPRSLSRALSPSLSPTLR